MMLTRGITLPTTSGLTAGVFNTPVNVGDVVIVESYDHLVSAAQVVGPLPNNPHGVEITIMLKPCKVVTRSTATGLFFSTVTRWAMSPLHAWYDALRARGENVLGTRHNNNGRLGSQRDLVRGSCTAEEAALYVRTVGVDRIVEALVRSARQRLRLRRVDHNDGLPTAWCDDRIRPGHAVIVGGILSDENEALYGVPPEVVPLASNGHVLADKLLSLNHWVAESYALWISRPKGTSRAKWQRAAALKFVQTLPVPADAYAMRHEPTVPVIHNIAGDASHQLVTLANQWPSASDIQRVVLRELPNGTRDPLLLARVVEDAMQELYRCSYMFTLHALSDTRWGVTIGRGYNEASFDVPAPSIAADILARDYQRVHVDWSEPHA